MENTSTNGDLPDWAQERIQIVEKLARDGRTKEAIAESEALVAEFPGNALVNYTQAGLIADHMNPFEGMRRVRKYLADFPEDPMGPALAAWIQLKIRRPRRALGFLDRAEALGASKGLVQGMRADALAISGRMAEARAASALAVQTATDPQILWTNALLNPPETEEKARAIAGHAASLGATSGSIAVFLAGWYAENNQHERAFAIMEEELSKNPNDEAVILRLADIEIKTDREDIAAERVRSALTRNPASITLSSWLSRYYSSRHRYLTAFKILCASFRAQRSSLPPW